ncbi:BOLA class I histocompatibility antigen, alpha chain BL3-6-like [Tautogolabrus adspersus]
MFWRKDGEELDEDVDHGEILPNHDGPFQMSVDLELPSDDWGRYECVFQLSGVKEDIVTKLDKREIKTNYGNPIYMTIVIIAGVLLLVTILCAAGFCLHKKINGERSERKHSNMDQRARTNGPGTPYSRSTPT